MSQTGELAGLTRNQGHGDEDKANAQVLKRQKSGPVIAISTAQPLAATEHRRGPKSRPSERPGLSRFA